MAVSLNASRDNNIQILGQLPSDSTGEVVMNLISRYDGSTYVADSSGVNSGSWIDLNIPQAGIPDYGGLYDSSATTMVEPLLTIDDITENVDQITMTIDEFIGDAEIRHLLDNLLVNVTGINKQIVTNNIIATQLTEYGIQTTADLKYGIETTTTEYEINVGDKTAYERQNELIENVVNQPAATENVIATKLTEHNVEAPPDVDYGIENDITEYDIDAEDETAYDGQDESRTTYYR